MNKFRIFVSTLVFVLLSNVVFAADDPISSVTFTLTSEQWVTSKTVRVVVSIDATFKASEIETVRSKLMQNLLKISNKGDWHITHFILGRGDAGLEKLSVQAEVRLPESEMTTLRARAKALTKPGETYEISAIDFKSSREQFETIRASLRTNIYNQINKELTRLNTLYPKRNFSVQAVDFNPPAPSSVRGMIFAAKTVERPTRQQIAVSDHLILTANVVLAAKFK